MTLGVDWSDEMATEFADDFHTATFTKTSTGAYSTADPAGPPAQTSTSFTCKALALGYDGPLVEGEQLTKATYSVVILRGTIRDDADAAAPDSIPHPGDRITVPPPGGTVGQLGAVTGVSSVTPASVTVTVTGPLL